VLLTWRAATVDTIRERRPGLVSLDATDDAGRPVRAVAYPDLVGEPVVGQRVLLNCTALDQGLGTGGVAFVVAPIDGSVPGDGDAPAGHLVKARYTPLQATIAGADEQGSAHHRVLADADDLDGMVVIVADLHSALPAILAGLYADAPKEPVAYVMTDGAALPVAFSATVAGLTAAGWLAGTISTGQAFGGDIECVSLHSGLLAARHVLNARVAIVAQGPGNLGTGTRWGFSGVAAGEAVNAAAVLDGRPVASLRISTADPRPRHRGISHHSMTAYGRVALRPADVVLPDLAGMPTMDAQLSAQVESAASRLAERHRLVRVPVDGLADRVRATPVPVRSMGRSFDDDPAYFLAAAAAGRHAAALL
jgi:hypothetical protein